MFDGTRLVPKPELLDDDVTMYVEEESKSFVKDSISKITKETDF